MTSQKFHFSKLYQLTIFLMIVGGIFGVFMWTQGGTTVNTLLRIPTLESGLVGHWTFDGKDMVSNVADRAGGNNGFLTGFTSTTTVVGKLGQALEFDGVNDLVNLGSGAILNTGTPFTISWWSKLDSFPAAFPSIGQFVSNSQEFEFGYSNSASYIDFWFGGSGSSWSPSRFSFPGAVPILGTWHFISITYNGSGATTRSNFSASVNGEPVTLSAAGTFNDQTAVNYLGNLPSLSTADFDGSIDDVRVYNRVLSSSEVQKLYQLGATTHINTTIETPTFESGLVGHWTFDGKNMYQNVQDVSGSGNTGYLSGFTSTTTSAGKLGQALQFDSVNDVVSVTTTSFSNTTGTFSMWVYPISIPTAGGLDNYVFCHSGDAGGGCGTSNRLYMRLESGAVTLGLGATGNISTGISVSEKQWTHLLVTYNAGNYVLYKNGVSALGGTYTNTLTIQPNAYIGSDQTSAKTFNGAIDDVRVHNRVLSSSEVQKLYLLGATTHINTTISPPSLTTGLVGHWTFDGKNMYQNAADSSGNGNTGYLTNFTSTTTVPGKIGQGLNFDGIDDRINGLSLSTLDDLGPLTASAWVNPKGIGQTGLPMIVGKAAVSNGTGFWYLFVDNSGDTWSLEFQKDFNTTDLNVQSVDNVMTQGEWQHVLVTWDGSSSASGVHLYVNAVETGYEITTSGSATETSDASGNVTIGSDSDGGSEFNGIIDDVRIYNRELSHEEVKALYNLGR